ncbi:MAG: slipin family protein [Bryobacteraceae bacterium]|nr:slipin family protein [Bryobacteraceae bacterium]
MLFLTRILVGDTERALVFRHNRFVTILGPGAHTLFHAPDALKVERHSILPGLFTSTWADFLVKERPALVAAHFTVVETSDAEVAMVYMDGKLVRVVPPGSRQLYWKGVREVRAEVINVDEAPQVPAGKLMPLAKLGREAHATFATVEENRVGLLYLDNRFSRLLEAGTHGFWTARTARVDVIDLRRQTLEVSGQEILTKDKVTIRVNILAEYRVTDPVKAGTLLRNMQEYLHRLLQLSVRQTLGRRTLDEVLAEKVDVDPEAARSVRQEMAEFGVEVGTIALKDVVLPGEIRDILNQVVAAEKQAQANLIRRREETAATRSLLNTAKLMEDNPILIRLKELETLEKLTAKVDHVTVHGGFEGMLTKLLTP